MPTRISVVVLFAVLMFWAAGCASSRGPALEHPEFAAVQVRTLAAGDVPERVARGFFISADGLVATCDRVVAGPAGTIIVTDNGGKPLRARLLVADADADLAILQVDDGGAATKQGTATFPYLRLSEQDAEPGTRVRAIGAAGITHGLFDAWTNFGHDIAFTAPITPTDCGAPLIADDGPVIGVVRGPSKEKPGDAEATPIWRVARLVPGSANSPHE